jgi:hypothetical protein
MTTMERGLRGIRRRIGGAIHHDDPRSVVLHVRSHLAPCSGAREPDWILGLVVVSLSALAIRQPRLHWAVAGMGAWILIQSAFLPHQLEATVWNERVVGALVLLLGWCPAERFHPRMSESPAQK